MMYTAVIHYNIIQLTSFHSSISNLYPTQITTVVVVEGRNVV